MRALKYLCFVWLVLFMFASPAAAQLEWRVSVKYILDADGERRPGFSYSEDTFVYSDFDVGNQVLAARGRGYRLDLTEIVDVSGISQWFDVDIQESIYDLEAAAEADPVTYVWRTDAINVYINGGTGLPQCSYLDHDIILIAVGAIPGTIPHEIGHYFTLCHTQGCNCTLCDPGLTGECHTTPGDDGLADTLPDLDCFDQDDIANFSFGQAYGDLTAEQQSQVDDVFFNIMSYHAETNRLTDDQMDRATDASNDARRNVTNGRTWFVDDDSTSLFPNGSSSEPYPTVLQGVDAAQNDDIVLLRGGSYAEVITITKRLTLRASRGTATIGN